MNEDKDPEKARARHERILAAAERLFQHYGQKKTTMADIAREVGIGVGSVYLEFSSKEAIVGELARGRTTTVIDAMRSAADRAAPDKRLEAMLVARVEALLEEAERGLHACDLVSCTAGASATSGTRMFGPEVRAVIDAELARRELADAERTPTLDAIEIAFGALSPPWLFKLPRERAIALAVRLSALLARGLA